MRNLALSITRRLMHFRNSALLAVFSFAIIYGVGADMYRWPPNMALEVGDAAQASEQADNTATRDGKADEATYMLTTQRHSYFQRDDKGSLELRNKLPVRSEKIYHLQRTIYPNKTAIVIMDPWTDMASEHLNQYFGRITKSRIMPLVNKALERGHPIIVLTNDPGTVAYNTKVSPELAALAAEGQADILYHQDLDDDAFAKHLRSRGIGSLIYMGFASNMCVIGRRMGMIPMVHHGFRLFFVPQASAAVEYPDTWENQATHHATTRIIAQWIAEIIDYSEFMQTRETGPD